MDQSDTDFILHIVWKICGLCKNDTGRFLYPNLFSVVLIAIGISLYMGAKLVNMPTEGLASAIASKLSNKEFHHVKVMVDCASVSAGIILSVIFLGGLQGIREGTIISAIVIGKVIPYANKVTRPLLQKFCFS